MGEVPAALVDQLTDDGRLIGPVDDGDQRLVLLRRTPDGLRRSYHERVRFVPLVR
jgi:protein-L-isoaspartate O-methyltransferase